MNIIQIKKEVKSKCGNFKKLNITLNGNNAYEVNSKIYTKHELFEAYKMGDL